MWSCPFSSATSFPSKILEFATAKTRRGCVDGETLRLAARATDIFAREANTVMIWEA